MARPMSALGQKQTFAAQNGVSAIPPKADMCSATRHVRFVPIADISELNSGLPRHAPLACLEAEGASGLEVDDQLELGRLEPQQ